MFSLLTKPTCLDGETFTVRLTVVLDCLLSKGEVGTGGDLIPDPGFEVCEWSLIRLVPHRRVSREPYTKRCLHTCVT